MGTLLKKEPHGLFFIAITGNNELMINKTVMLLKRKFGKTLSQSQLFNFSEYTNYYEKEMGKSLLKTFLIFDRLIPIKKLPHYKLKTNKLEMKSTIHLRTKKNRKINLDPGCITLSKIILASTKDHAHRLYISKKIFLEITLVYKKKTFTKLEWTYPDYYSKDSIIFFNEIRMELKKNYLNKNHYIQ